MQLLHQKLNEKIHSTRVKLENMPDGKLICAKNENRYKWYVSDGHKNTYLPKKERKLAEILAEKKYLKLQLDELEEEERAISLYLHAPHNKKGKAELLFENSTEYQKLLGARFKPVSKELEEWANESYESKASYKEGLNIKTISGKFVRSKSESIIDMLLTMHKLPYRYEAPLRLEGITIYPDFTIRHPKTGQYYYWEHFGMMDDPLYVKKACEKIQCYSLNGIIPSKQLILSYESKEYPLSPQEVKRIIDEFFV